MILATGELEIIDGALVDREEAAGRAIFRRHVADRGAVGERKVVEAGTVEFDEAADDALLAKHLGDGQDQVGGSDALLELTRRRKPTTSGMSMLTGWPSIAASASIPPTPQPSTPRPLTIVVWLSVPTSVSG